MGKFQKSIEGFIKTNNFHYVLLITTVTIFAGALGMQLTEDKTFADSLWWSFVTATTVGYGDISPATTQGRIIVAILMISGIGFISMLIFWSRKSHGISGYLDILEKQIRD